jgi:hypothetical protein
MTPLASSCRCTNSESNAADDEDADDDNDDDNDDDEDDGEDVTAILCAFGLMQRM